MRKLGLLATAAVLSLAGATASRAQSVIVQDPAVVPGQQIVTERIIEPGLFGDRFVRERTTVTQPMVTEQTVVAPAPTIVAPAPTVRRSATVRSYVEPRYTVQQRAPVVQPGVTTVVTTDPVYRSGWDDYAYQPTYSSSYTNCVTDFDGIRRCY